MLGWTAHFASAVNWGAGKGASSISGSPFHMTLLGFDNGDGTSGGNQDRSTTLGGDLVTGGTIVIKKLTDPASDTTTAFGFTGTGGITPTSFNLKNGEMETFVSVAPGTYTVSESTVPAGWALTNLVCVDPTGNSTTSLAMSKATIDVASGETVTCTFTNTQAGTLTVTKVTIPNDTTTGFPITASGTGTISGSPNQTVKSGAPVSYTVTAGTYSVSETPPAGWTQTGNTCTNVTVTAGQTASCTITNTQVSMGPPQLIVIKHVINNNGGTKSASDFTITASGTAVPGGTTSFPGAEAPGTTLSVSPGTYTVAETVLTGYVPTFSGDCTNVTIADGQTKTCTITNLDVRPAPPTFCSKSMVTSLLSPTGRFKNNKGVDNLVRVDLGESIQDAVDTATDANNDGYIIIGVVAGPGTPAPYGGHTAQRVTISQQYPKPFALVGCSVTMHDPNRGDGLPTGLIAATASSPVSTSNPASILVADLHGADSELAGWKVEGTQRELRNVNASGSPIGLWITGARNTIVNGVVQSNSDVGILVGGDGNVLDSLDTMGNQGHGIQVTGKNNQIKKLDAGDIGKGNGGDGANVSGTGNVISEMSAFANAGHGIAISGASNQILNAFAGDKGKGNGGDGIRVTSSGNLIQVGRTNANAGDGINVGGGTQAAPNRLKSNQSNTGQSGSVTENGGAEYRLVNYVTNFGGNNRADNIVVPKTTAPAKCATFPATNVTVNFPSPITCE